MQPKARKRIHHTMKRILLIDFVLVRSRRSMIVRFHLLDRVERTITIPNDVLVPEVKIGSEPDVGHRESSHFTVAATRRICFWMEERRSLGRTSACSRDFQTAAVF